MKATCPQFNCLTQRVHSTAIPVKQPEKKRRTPLAQRAGESDEVHGMCSMETLITPAGSDRRFWSLLQQNPSIVGTFGIGTNAASSNRPHKQLFAIGRTVVNSLSKPSLATL